ncbi:nitrate/nitrite transporter [uncultured Piscinibacter sp.]|uniref:MFS transporter n=1 Tax=uncultured Piscinibacter sp. TaxID=1131835 RepID=UPI00260A305D|nr:MFS transporter [uncultured Piscinibacter sp.]
MQQEQQDPSRDGAVRAEPHRVAYTLDISLAAADRATAVLLSVGYAVALFHRTAFQAIAPQVGAEFGLSAAATADLAAVFFWTYLAIMIPTGLLTDAIGARRVAVLGCVVSAAGSFLFRIGDSIVELTLARVLIAAGSPAAFVGLMRFVALTFPERRATFSGRGILLGNVGAVCSGAPLALLLGVVVWRDIWLGLGILSLALAAAPFLLGRHMRPRNPRVTPPRDPWRELITLLGSRSVLLGVALQAGLAGTFYAFANVVAPRWLEAGGFEPVAAGWMISILIAGYGLGAAFWGWIGDREHQRTRALLVAGLLAMLGWVAVAWLPVSGGAAVAMLFLSIGLVSGAFVLIYALITERHSPNHAGGVVACVNCGIPLGAALLASSTGRLSDTAAPWLLSAASSVTVLGACALLNDRRRRPRASARDPAVERH